MSDVSRPTRFTGADSDRGDHSPRRVLTIDKGVLTFAISIFFLIVTVVSHRVLMGSWLPMPQ
jgi:hypothetical protein